MGRRLGPTNAEKRRAIVEAAAVVVAERGREATLAEICGRARVSRQTVYNHHGDKDGLFAAVAAQGLEPCPCCQEAAAPSPLEDRLARYAATLLEWIYAPHRMTALRACCRALDSLKPGAFGARGPALRSLAAVLRREAQHGWLSVSHPVAAANVFLDLVLAGPQLRIVLGCTTPPSAAEIEARARDCARLYLRGWGEPRPPIRPSAPERGRAPPRGGAGPRPAPAP